MNSIKTIKAAFSRYKARVLVATAAYMIKFTSNHLYKSNRAYTYIVDLIGLVVTLIFGVYMIPIVVDAVQATNTTDWTFTGHEGAKAMYLLIPFIFIIGLVIYFVVALIYKAKSGQTSS